MYNSLPQSQIYSFGRAERVSGTSEIFAQLLESIQPVAKNTKRHPSVKMVLLTDPVFAVANSGKEVTIGISNQNTPFDITYSHIRVKDLVSPYKFSS